jgi:isocitrate lyase
MNTTATATPAGVDSFATRNRWDRGGPRWKDIVRPYSKEEVERLRGTVKIEYTLARLGSERLWKLLQEEDYVAALGALTGNQAVQQVHAGLKAIYLSGWQVAADANLAGQMYPDQSLYPANSVPAVIKRINNALLRADQIRYLEGRHQIHWLAPIVADAEAGYPGKLLAYNCSPSFNWKKKLDGATIARFQRELGAMGYKFQFITLAGFHALNYSMFRLARRYKERGMTAYAELQEAEFAAEVDGYSATRHQREVGTAYFDEVSQVISEGESSTTALHGSTETDQFH